MSGVLTPVVVAVAGGLGAALRHLADTAATRRWGAGQVRGILVVNLAGALVAGLAVGALPSEDAGLRVAGLGLLGGFTTFSTAMLHTLRLAAVPVVPAATDVRAPLGTRALAHAVGTAVGSVLAAALGLALGGLLGG